MWLHMMKTLFRIIMSLKVIIKILFSLRMLKNCMQNFCDKQNNKNKIYNPWYMLYAATKCVIGRFKNIPVNLIYLKIMINVACRILI